MRENFSWLPVAQIIYMLFCFIHEGFWNQSFPSVTLSDRQHYSEMLELIPAIWTSPMGIKELTRIPSFYFHLVLSTRLRGESPFKGRLESWPRECNFWTINWKIFWVIFFQYDAARPVGFKSWSGLCFHHPPILSLLVQRACWTPL